jgi:hypothetical protein
MQFKNVKLRIAGAFMLSAMLPWGTLAAQTVSTAPAPDRNVAPPGAQRQQPPQPQKQLPGTRAPQPISPKLSDGVIEGFVYWDTSLIPHKPADSCNGLAVTVSVDNGLSAPFKGWKPLATLANNFKYVGQVRNFLSGGKVVTYDVCTYGYDQVPVGTELQVQLTVTQVFARNAVPQPAVVGPITIINGQCNMLPSLNPKTLADLTAHWGSCQKMAYNVSFVLEQVLQTQSAGGGARKPGSNSRAVPVSLSAPKQGRKITNPKAGAQDGAIIAVLQKQRSAADAEAAQMKLGIRPAGVQASSGPSQTMATTAGGRAPNTPAPIQKGAISPSPGSAAHPSPGVSGTLPPQFNNLALTCSHDPTMRVLTVSGGPNPVVFTPDAKYNFYTITGCSFGNPGTNSKAYIYYQGTFREDFQIQEWTDNWIKLSLAQNISGIDDQKDVTLVIQSADGKQWSKSGYRFYAARQTVLLNQIPQSDFSLNHFRPDNSATQTWKATYTSGSSPTVVPNFSGLSAEVHWDITTGPDGTLVGGNDLYDFSHLHPTFVLDSALMEWKDVACDLNDSYIAASKNNWSIDWYGASGVQVSWQAQTCNGAPQGSGGPFHPDTFVSPPESNYGIDVWVTGPRGLDPWTGKPTS